MSAERNASYRNMVHTPLNPNCRLCHYAGYSNVCTFFSGGECPYISMRKSIYATSPIYNEAQYQVIPLTDMETPEAPNEESQG